MISSPGTNKAAQIQFLSILIAEDPNVASGKSQGQGLARVTLAITYLH